MKTAEIVIGLVQAVLSFFGGRRTSAGPLFPDGSVVTAAEIAAAVERPVA